ncbi:MAG: hypothetical protein ACPGJV_13315 [Bacteriovoracaceae bacterium]
MGKRNLLILVGFAVCSALVLKGLLSSSDTDEVAFNFHNGSIDIKKDSKPHKRTSHFSQVRNPSSKKEFKAKKSSVNKPNRFSPGKRFQKGFKQRRPAAAIKRKFFRGAEAVEFNGVNFLVSPSLWALKDEPGQFHFKRYGYYFSEEDDLGAKVLFNQQTQQMAVLTGRLILKNLSKAQVESLGVETPYNVNESIDHLNTFFIVPDDSSQFQELLADVQRKIASNPELAKLEVEIVQGGSFAK